MRQTFRTILCRPPSDAQLTPQHERKVTRHLHGLDSNAGAHDFSFQLIFFTSLNVRFPSDVFYVKGQKKMWFATEIIFPNNRPTDSLLSQRYRFFSLCRHDLLQPVIPNNTLITARRKRLGFLRIAKSTRYSKISKSNENSKSTATSVRKHASAPIRKHFHRWRRDRPITRTQIFASLKRKW